MMQTILVLDDRQIRILSGPSVVVEPLGDASWRVPPSDLAAMAARLLMGPGPLRACRTLILSAAWCYVHEVVLPVRRPSHAALCFALEEFLPVDVETLTCAFERTSGNAWLAVGVPTITLRALLDELGKVGIAFDRILPSPLALTTPDGSSIWCDREHTAISEWRGGRPLSLRIARHHAAGVEQRSEMLPKPPAEPVRVRGVLAEDELAALATAMRAKVGESPSELATNIGFDLAHGVLGGTGSDHMLLGAIRAATAGLAAALLLAMSLWFQQLQTTQQTAAVAEWERAQFVALFPGQPLPAAPALRIASERRRLAGLTAPAAQSGSDPTNALETLRQIVAALPKEIRIDLEELRVERGETLLRGRTNDHAQAERIANALRALSGWSCDPPRTDRAPSGGVQFALRATAVSKESKP